MDSISTESLFKKSGIKGRLVIIPRELSAGCGMAWRSEPEWEEAIRRLEVEHDLKFKQVAIL